MHQVSRGPCQPGKLDPSFDCRSSHIINHVFPYMKVDWRTHPTTSALLHAGLFPMSRRTARQLRWQGDPERLQYVPHGAGATREWSSLDPPREGVPFKHPVDIGDSHQATCAIVTPAGLDRSDGHDASDQEKLASRRYAYIVELRRQWRAARPFRALR